MNHYRKTIRKYQNRQKTPDCPFCNPDTIAKAIYESEVLYIVPNLTPYDLWELHNVEDHLLVIPKRHVESLGELNNKERLSVMDTIADYEGRGYNIYARGVDFVKRSVRHQHTHLIKVGNQKPKVALFVRTPYYLLKR